MRFILSLAVAGLLAHCVAAEDADALREKGIAALKDSQANPRAIVDAARFFVKAGELYGAAGNDEKNVETNSFLYWCKKKMTLEDIDAFRKGGESAVSNKLADVEKLAPKADDAQKWFDRAEAFANQNPAEHLLIAIRFFEVADRFQGSAASLKAQDRSLKELVQDKSSGAKSSLPPVAVAAPKLAPETGGNLPVPALDKIKDAEKLIKDLFKADYAKTDSPTRLALAAKLVQQADENMGDAAAEYVLLRDARDFAVGAGDAALAASTQQRLRDSFKLDFAAILIDLRRLEASAKTAESAAALAALFQSAADDALEADNFEQAVRFSARTEDLLPAIKDAALKARLKTEIAFAHTLNRDSAPALAALITLTTKPDDSEANLAAGKFALERGKYEAAFALLAKGPDGAISAVAKRELVSLTEAAEQVLTADGWFDCAEKEPYNYLKVRMQERAALWYGNALPALSGLPKLRVEGRLKAAGSATTLRVPIGIGRPTATGKAIDLLKLIDVTNSTQGKWHKDAAGTIDNQANHSTSRIRAQYHPEAEYDVHCVLSRKSGTGSVGIVLVQNGKQGLIEFFSSKGAGINKVSTAGYRFQDNRDYDVVIEVRTGSIALSIESKNVFTQNMEGRSLVSSTWNSIGDDQGIGLFCEKETMMEVKRFEIIPMQRKERGPVVPGRVPK
jgi:hypothetical protein